MKRAIVYFAVGLICFLLFAYLLCAALWLREAISTLTYIFAIIFVGAGGICTALSAGIVYEGIKKAEKDQKLEQVKRRQEK